MSDSEALEKEELKSNDVVKEPENTLILKGRDLEGLYAIIDQTPTMYGVRLYQYLQKFVKPL